MAAASLALKKLLSKSVLAPNSLVATSATATPAIPRRLFNANAVRRSDDAGDRFYSRDDLFPRDPSFFGPARTSAVLHLMGTSSPFPWRGWDYCHGFHMKETKAGLQLRMELVGLGMEDVKVSMEHNNMLVVEAKGGEEEGKRRYICMVELLENRYKIDVIKTEMNNGVLEVVLPFP